MAREVWLHIGTPKSGTTALQRHLTDSREALAGQGLAYVAPEGKTSSNDLVVAMNKGRAELPAIAEALNRQIETCAAPRAILSSEMLYGVAPDRLYELLPALTESRVKVLVYLRRQDRYIEAMFLQKSKNGRFYGSIADYIAKFDGSGSDFARELAPWADYPDATLVPRVLEPARLSGGNVASDALDQIGLAPPEDTGGPEANVSPGYHRVQLLQAASRAGIVPPRRLQRLLAARFPQDPAERTPIFTQSERRAYLANYAQGNETLRSRYFPDQKELFSTEDLSLPDEDRGIPPFTEAQLREITSMLAVMKQLVNG